jgi:hypothetical protein
MALYGSGHVFAYDPTFHIIHLTGYLACKTDPCWSWRPHFSTLLSSFTTLDMAI